MNSVSYLLIFIIFIFAASSASNAKMKMRRPAMLNSDIKNAYTAAQAYFTDYPDATVTLAKLKSYGFTPRIDPPKGGPDPYQIVNGSKDELTIKGFHPEIFRSYTVYSDGRIEFEEREIEP